MKSIRHDLSVRLLVGALALLAISGVLVGIAVRARLVAEFDHTLETGARALVALTEREDDVIEVDFSPDHMPAFGEDAEDPEFFDLRMLDGTVVAKSPSLGDTILPLQLPPPLSVMFADVDLPDGGQGRMVQLAFEPFIEMEEDEEDDVEEEENEEEPFALFEDAEGNVDYLVVGVARSRSDLNALLLSVYGVLAGIDLLLLGAIVVLVRVSVAHSLQPLAEINTQVASIGADALENRVEIDSPPEELRAIVRTINDLVQRMAHAFERERQFSSDVAHELRTPVSELKTACEVGQRWPDNPETIQQFFSDVREIAGQMEGVVSNLLVLARCDEGTASIELETLELSPFLRDCWKHVAETAAARNVSIEYKVDSGTSVETDAEKLVIIVQNLLGNAVAYCEAGTAIRVVASVSAQGVELTVENQTTALDENDLGPMFDRFWRKDSARTGASHAGLGLSIVAALCELLEIELKPELSGGNTFRMWLSFGVRKSR